MTHHVELVEDDLVVRVGDEGANRFEIRIPHVHGDRRDGRAFLRRQLLEIRGQRLLRPPIGYVQHRLRVEVDDQRDVLLPSQVGVLIDA